MKISLLIILLYNFAFSQNVQMMGGAKIKLQGNVKAKLYGDFEINSSTFTQSGSNTFSLNGNWVNTGEYNANSAMVNFFGSNTQTIVNTSNNDFYDMYIGKSNGIVQLTSSTINVLNDLSFNSSSYGNLFTRDNALVYVYGDVLRLNGGFVDGYLALNFTANDNTTTTFVIGRDNAYTPVEIDFDGTNLAGGFVQAISDPRDVYMLGSQLDSTQNVEREYTIGKPSSSTFDIGSGTFTMNIHYINPDDIRNGADPTDFVTARYDGPVWGQFLLSALQTTNSSVMSGTNAFGTYVVGPEDFFQNIYSTTSGSFSEPSNWSLYGYGSPYPSGFAPRSRDNAFVGDGDNIALDADIAVLTGRTFTLEQAGPSGEQGQLTMDNYVLSGAGTFTLKSGGILSVGDVDGITQVPTNAGNIRTSTRNYNLANHSNGNFIYTAQNNGVTGDGLPDDVHDFEVNSTAIVTLQKNVNVSRNMTISSGTFDVDDKIITGTNSGTFSISDGNRIAIGDMNNAQISIPGFNVYDVDANSTFEFNGSTQTISLLPLNFSTALGYGNVVTNNIGTKTVASNLNIRGDLYILGSSMFNNQVGVNNLRVYGNIANISSGLQNDGFIYVGP